jgi:hypothetical protein
MVEYPRLLTEAALARVLAEFVKTAAAKPEPPPVERPRERTRPMKMKLPKDGDSRRAQANWNYCKVGPAPSERAPAHGRCRGPLMAECCGRPRCCNYQGLMRCGVRWGTDRRELAASDAVKHDYPRACGRYSDVHMRRYER